MSIVDDVKRYYDEVGISAINFRCKHLEDCKRGCADFTEAREAYIGREYESGDLPRLLFLSLDPGNSDVAPDARTIEACRDWEENHCDVKSLPKNLHWYRTHELALKLLQPFKPDDLSLPEVHSYFAHTNSAKCCMNKAGRHMADKHMFRSCREYIPGELAALLPDILVTQGDMAKDAIPASFISTIEGDLKRCGYATLDLNGRKVLWIHTYHPRNFGGFNRQRKECYHLWTHVVKGFVAGQSSA